MADIRRQDIIDEKILRIGQEIADSFKKGYSQIKKENANIKKDLQNMVKSAREAEKSLAKASSPKELSEGTKKLNKSQQDLLRTQKLLHDVNIKAEKAAQAKIRTQQLETKETERQKKAQERENREKQKSTVAYQKQQIQKQEAIKNAKQEARQVLGLSGAYDKLTKELNDARAKYKDMAASGTASNKALQRQQRIVQNLDNRVKKVDASVGQFQRNVGNYPRVFGAATSSLRGFIGALGLAGGIAAFAMAFRDTTRRVREFDKEMQNIAGVMGSTRKEIKPMEEAIISVAGSSIKTSNEVAQLASTLVTLGNTQEEVIQLLKPVNDLSIALNATSEETADFLGQTLNAFGKGAESGQEFADIIANVRSSTALDFQRIKDALGFVAPTAAALNLTLGQTSALIGVLQDNGVKAARAGRLLNSSFARLIDQGISLDEALIKIQQSTNKVKTSQEIFGTEAFGLGIILSNNTDRIKELGDEFDNLSEGSLKKLTDQQLQSLDAQLKILDSTWESFVLSVENGEGAVASFTKNGIQFLINTIIGLQTVSQRFELIFKGIDDASNQALDALIRFGETDSGKKIADVIEEATRGFTQNKIAENITFFETKIAAALVKLGEDLEESQILAQRWTQTFFEGFQKAKEAAEETEGSIDDVLTPLQEYARSLEGLSLERLKLETELLTEEQNRLKVAFDKTGDTKYEDKLQTIADKLNIVSNAAKIAASSLPSLEGLEKLEAIGVFERTLTEGEKRFVDFVKKQFDLQEDLGEESIDNLQERVNRELEIIKEKNQKEIESEREKERLKEEFRRSASNATIRLASDVTNTLFENQQIRLDIALDRLNDEEEAQIESLNRQFDAAQGNAEQQEAIEKRIAQTKEEFAKREADIKERQARLEKQQALFQIAINTATSVAKTAAELGFPAAIPFIALAVAQGAAQAALVASKPVPQYAEGTDNSERDFIAGEKGRELVLHNNKAFITPDKPTFYKNMKGARVFSNEDTMKIVGQSIFDPTFMNMDTQPDDRQGKEMVREIQSMHRTLRRKKEYIFDKQPTGWKSNETKIKRLKNA